jgi:hypothetical protein
LRGAKYLYQAKISNQEIYNGIIDPLKYFSRLDFKVAIKTIIGKGYKGLIYRGENGNCLAYFYPIKVKGDKIMKNRYKVSEDKWGNALVFDNEKQCIVKVCKNKHEAVFYINYLERSGNELV